MAIAKITGQGLAAIACSVALLWACFVGERLTVHAPGQVGYGGGEQVTVNLPVTDTHVFAATEAETALR